MQCHMLCHKDVTLLCETVSFSEANKYFRELLQPAGLFCGVSMHEIDRFLTNKYPIPIKRGVSRDTWGSG